MNLRLRSCLAVLLSCGLALALAACGSRSDGRPGGGAGGGNSAKAYKVCDPANVRRDALIAFFEAREGDVIEFCEGTYDLPTGLILNGKRGITIKGAGKDKTILSFRNSDSAEGINASHCDGITIQGLTVEDTPGNGIRVFRSRYVTLRDVRARWRDAEGRTEKDAGYTPRESHGAYGLYPVEARHVLIEDSEAHGASDAGIYVGQTSDVIVRRTRAEYNVAGFEFENTYRAVFEDNVATNNVGGFLVFDLPGLSQYGEKNIVRNNKSYANNTDNFAPIGNIVGLTPRGTGMLILASDQLEIYGNEVHDNDTVGIAIVNFALADPNQPDKKYDFFPEGVEIHGNTFRDNGGNPQQPDPERGEGSLLPLLLRIKNLGRGAHIVWDGAEDKPADCAPPVDEQGVPLTQPNPGQQREEPRTDERGRPNFQRSDPEPECKYNAWKFDDEGGLKKPENGLCIAEDNTYENSKPATLLTTPFLNAKLTSSSLPQLLLDLLKPASNNLAPHRCDLPARPDPVLQLPYKPSGASDPRPSEAEVARLCGKGGSTPNFEAAARVNCPRLDQYGLFADPQDPTKNASGGGVGYDLNSALFSDYASKYRFIYLPPGTKARYKDHADGPQATLDMPVGTVIAKTFAFRKEAADGALISENVVETRLLIKRQTAQGVNWVGLPYIWKTENGRRVAELKVEGGEASVEYDYLDHDPDVKTAGGQRRRYTGSAARYGIPAALNCVTCHGGDDKEPGAAPIGLKPRFMNKTARYGSQDVNQLQHLKDLGLLEGLPADAAGIEKAPRWNVPGDSGALPDSADDIHQRVRAYLEVNCAHCHQPNGGASNSGLFLDAYRAVDIHYGICKKPVAAGRGSGGKLYDIIPKDAAGSILPFRVGSAEPGVRMPPIARSVVHGEAANLITSWIDTVLPTEDTADEEACTGAGLPLGALSSAASKAKAAAAPLKSNDQRQAEARRKP